MTHLNLTFLAALLAILLASCGPGNDSELDFVRTQQSDNRMYRVLHQEIGNGWVRLSLVGTYLPKGKTIHAITACFGATNLCESGVAKPDILYVSDAVRNKIGAESQHIPPGMIDPGRDLVIQFPSEINVQRGTFINIETYFAEVGVRSGWIVPLPSLERARNSKQAVSEQEKLVEFDRDRKALKSMPMTDRHHETLFMQKDYSFEYQMQALQREQQIMNEMFANISRNIQNMGNNINNGNVNPQPNGNYNSNNLDRPNNQNGPNISLPNSGSLDAGEVLDQGATNYCWGYSAFHMVRAFYFNYAKNSPWAKEIAALNSHENMATWMRSNFPNQGNNPRTWLDEFQSQKGLSDDGWGYNGTVAEAAANMQGDLIIPVSYCDGRHCVALVGVNNDQFEVLDSAGGVKKRKSVSSIGRYQAVTLSRSEAQAIISRSGSTQPQSQQPANPLQPSNPLQSNPLAGQNPAPLNQNSFLGMFYQ